MTVAKKTPLVAGLDIGTQKVALVIGEHTDAGLEILGVGTAASRGIKSGRVADVEKTTQAISVALSEAELMAGCEIHQARVSISGDHVRGTNSHGVVAIDNGEVSNRAARRVIEAAQAVPLPADQVILHLMCREYVVDGQGGILDPVGMSGIRLEANLHVISACESALGNIRKCCHRAGLGVSGVVASSLAAAEAVLEPEERELGVAVVDFGAGTVDVAVYHGGSIVHSFVLTVAGLHVTRDLAQVLETSMREAETIKLHDGRASVDDVEPDTYCEVGGVGGRPPRVVSRRHVAEIIQPRLEEIFDMVHEGIVRSGHRELLSSGVVLCGGSAMMPGIVSLASRVLDMPVRLGEPRGLAGLSDEVDDPSWATAVGLARGLLSADLGTSSIAALRPRVMPQWLWRKWKEYF
ncbi:MAG: cell division protein FtsA [Deltaproteobacteria bacterium]|nr:MAG: cell division protein FtsA [Deltaproteobacteria bacterium]